MGALPRLGLGEGTTGTHPVPRRPGTGPGWSNTGQVLWTLDSSQDRSGRGGRISRWGLMVGLPPSEYTRGTRVGEVAVSVRIRTVLSTVYESLSRRHPVEHTRK